jgi:hypothetical protein
MSVKKILWSVVFLLIVFSAKAQHPKFNFQHLVFHAGYCYGPCPIFDLQIDSSGNALLHAEVYTPAWIVDSSRSGYFSGHVSDSVFQNLIAILERTGLDTVKYVPELCCDGSLITIISYHNNHRDFFETMWPPESMGKLIWALYDVCQKTSWKRCAEFKLER